MADKIQWHPGFRAGIELEFQKFHVDIEPEYQLTRGPLEIDILIIKKLTDEAINNQVGNLFRRHNIIEYKGPGDDLNIDVFYKIQAYAALYKSAGESVNAIPAEEITVTYWRDAYPRKLMADLKKAGIVIEEQFPGVYYLSNNTFFPSQIIVSSQLESKDLSMMKILKRGAKESDVKDFIRLSTKYTSQGDRAKIDAILSVSISANEKLFRDIYGEGDDTMCQALYDIMKEDIEKRVSLGMQQGMLQGEQKGEDKSMALMMKLFSLGRMDDAQRSAADPAFRQKMFKEFNMA